MESLHPIVIATIMFLLLALGDVISTRTRARIPAILVAIVGYLVLVWTEVINPDVISSSVVNQFGIMVISIALVHLGTMIPLPIMAQQWRSVLIAVCGLIIAIALILLIVTAVFDYATAVSGSGPIAGGILAMLITIESLQDKGLEHLLVIPATVIGIQGLVGIPLASAMLRRYAALHIQTPAFAAAVAAQQRVPHLHGSVAPSSSDIEDELEEPETAPERQALIPARYLTPSVVLAITALVGSLAIYLGEWTGLNYGIWSLLLGVAGHYLRIFPPKALERANSFGIVTAGIMVVVLASMGGVTFSDVIKSAGPVFLILALGVVGLMAGGLLASRFVGWSRNKAVPVSLTALIGFPADYIICEEIANSLGENEEERAAIMDEIMAPMLVGGFTSVSLASVVIASMLVGTL